MTSSLPSATDLAGWTLAAQHPLTRQWCDETPRLTRLAKHHEFDLRPATDLDLAAQRTRLAPGHEPEELLNRYVRVLPDLLALLSIRFEAGDATKPFVDASALSRPVTQDDLRALGATAGRVFGSFDPRYLWLWSAAPVDAYTGTRRDRRFLAAPLRELATRRAHVPAELFLAAATDLSRWKDAVDAYAAVDAEHPAHPEQARIQDADDLQENIDDGTLFDVLVDQAWAGWIAASTDTYSSLGLSCYEVQEIILTPRFRGHGYGPHLYTLLAQHLPDPTRVLVGTIHADNRGALEAAKHVGRHDIGGWFQLLLPAA